MEANARTSKERNLYFVRLKLSLIYIYIYTKKIGMNSTKPYRSMTNHNLLESTI